MDYKKQRPAASSSSVDAGSIKTPQAKPSRLSASPYQPLVQSGDPRNPPTQAEPSHGSTPHPTPASYQTPQAQSLYHPTQQAQYAFFPSPQAQIAHYPTQPAQSSYYPTAQAQAAHYRSAQSVSSYSSFGHAAYPSYSTTRGPSSFDSARQPVYPYPPTTRGASAFAPFLASTQSHHPISQAVPLSHAITDTEKITGDVVQDAEGKNVEEIPDAGKDPDEETPDAEGDYESPDGEPSAPPKPSKRKAYARVSATRITADHHAFLDRLIHLCGPESQASPTPEQLAASLGCTRTNIAKRLGKALDKVVGKGAYKVFKTLKLVGYAPNGGEFNMGTLIRHVRTHGVNRSYLVAYRNRNYRKPVKPSQSVLDIEAGARRQR